MSVRRRAIHARLTRRRRFNGSWQTTSDMLERMRRAVSVAISDHAAHMQLDTDGAPPMDPPTDAWLKILEDAVLNG